jgi:hypothetical protein
MAGMRDRIERAAFIPGGYRVVWVGVLATSARLVLPHDCPADGPPDLGARLREGRVDLAPHRSDPVFRRVVLARKAVVFAGDPAGPRAVYVGRCDGCRTAFLADPVPDEPGPDAPHVVGASR